MRYELIKIFRQVHVKAAFTAVILLSMILGVVSAGSFSSSQSADSSTYLKGKSAFVNERKKYETVSGDITIIKLNEALQYIKRCPNEWEAYVKGNEAYPGIMYILEQAYVTADGHYPLFETANADDFYERDSVQIRQQIEDRGLKFSDREIKDILAWSDKITKPYKNEMALPWRRFYTSFQFVLLLNFLTVIIYASNLHSNEKTRRMDLILGTTGHQGIQKVVVDKVKALVCLTSGQYLASIAAVSMVYFGISGPIAWKSQIQTLYFTSILPLTYQQLFLTAAGSGMLACLAAAVFSAALNARLYRAVPAMIIGIAATFLPLLLQRFTMLPNGIQKLIDIFPVNAALAERTAQSLQLYPFWGNGMPAVYVIPAAAVLLAAAGVWYGIRAAGKYMCVD